jgi:hypothetical protein
VLNLIPPVENSGLGFRERKVEWLGLGLQVFRARGVGGVIELKVYQGPPPRKSRGGDVRKEKAVLGSGLTMVGIEEVDWGLGEARIKVEVRQADI